MNVRDRVRELRRIPARDLCPHPLNWRTHPDGQRAALRGSLASLGYADALIARELPDGSLQLLDGHLRAETTPDATVPVLVVDLADDEAAQLLATLDPIAALAGTDRARLAEVVRQFDARDEALRQVVASLLPPAPAGAAVEDVEDDLGDEDALDLLFKAPFPYFGGKARVARRVWRHLGDVSSYVEPFFGSGAVLLSRPLPVAGLETVNDLDGLVCNVWRAIRADPGRVAEWADWPVLENDLHARHAWLVGRKDSLQARLEGDPDFFDPQVAGWWLWGMACWIGSQFCVGDGPWQVVEAEDGSRRLVHLGDAGQGVNRRLVHLGDAGRGVNRQLVHLSGAGQGVNRQLVSDGDTGVGKAGCGERGLLAWMQALSERLRRVRVACGDWTRVCGGASGDCLAHLVQRTPCGLFLDPPYSALAGRASDLYTHDDLQVAHAVRDWAVAHGDDPRLRIVLCGYEGEHALPPSWRCVRWQAHGGMALTAHAAGTAAQANRYRERLWLSPHCLP